MFAEDQHASGNLLPTSSVQCAAGTNPQATLPDQRPRELLPSALSTDDNVSPGEADQSRTKGHLLLTQTGNLCGTGSGRRGTCTTKQCGNAPRSTGRRCSGTGSERSTRSTQRCEGCSVISWIDQIDF